MHRLRAVWSAGGASGGAGGGGGRGDGGVRSSYSPTLSPSRTLTPFLYGSLVIHCREMQRELEGRCGRRVARFSEVASERDVSGRGAMGAISVAAPATVAVSLCGRWRENGRERTERANGEERARNGGTARRRHQPDVIDRRERVERRCAASGARAWERATPRLRKVPSATVVGTPLYAVRCTAHRTDTLSHHSVVIRNFWPRPHRDI